MGLMSRTWPVRRLRSRLPRLLASVVESQASSSGPPPRRGSDATRLAPQARTKRPQEAHRQEGYQEERAHGSIAREARGQKLSVSVTRSRPPDSANETPTPTMARFPGRIVPPGSTAPSPLPLRAMVSPISESRPRQASSSVGRVFWLGSPAVKTSHR